MDMKGNGDRHLLFKWRGYELNIWYNMCLATCFQPPNVSFRCQTPFFPLSCCLDEWKSEFVKRGFDFKTPVLLKLRFLDSTVGKTWFKPLIYQVEGTYLITLKFKRSIFLSHNFSSFYYFTSLQPQIFC